MWVWKSTYNHFVIFRGWLLINQPNCLLRKIVNEALCCIMLLHVIVDLFLQHPTQVGTWLSYTFLQLCTNSVTFPPARIHNFSDSVLLSRDEICGKRSLFDRQQITGIIRTWTRRAHQWLYLYSLLQDCGLLLSSCQI